VEGLTCIVGILPGHDKLGGIRKGRCEKKNSREQDSFLQAHEINLSEVVTLSYLF
jgi:hypothetical protein